MKKIIGVVIILSCASASLGQNRVRTYVKKNGTVVHTHSRTKANRTKSDNYSTKGNRNPYTGKKGRKRL
jgi:hypothetical protein